MKKLYILIIGGLAIVTLAIVTLAYIRTDWLPSSNDRDRSIRDVDKLVAAPTPHSLQNIQVNQATILPPFGIQVRADMATLKIQVRSSIENTQDRLETIQNAVEHISALAGKDESIALQTVSLRQVNDGADRGISESYFGERYDSSSVVLTLATNLTENDNLLTSLTAFNAFLNTISVPDTTAIDTLSITAEISNPEEYRQQVIAKVYAELAAIQADYSQPVKFEINGLHSELRTMPISDTDYYLYLEPTIVVNEF